MKKNNQVYVLLLILLCLAVFVFLYYTHRVKFLEGLGGEDETDEVVDDGTDEVVYDGTDEVVDDGTDEVVDDGTDEVVDDEADGVDGADESETVYESTGKMTGKNIQMSETNSKSVSSVIQDLEKDYDTAIPLIENKIETNYTEIKDESKDLSKRINAVDRRLAEFLRSVPSGKAEPEEKKASITVAGSLIKK
jgi:hypothetical protein